MTVRLKITALITAAGFVTSLVFSCIILWEMIEQPLSVIDADLESAGLQAGRQVGRLAAADRQGDASASWLLADKRYWLVVRDQASGSALYRSYLAQRFQVEAPPEGQSATVLVVVPPQVPVGQDAHGKIVFRVRTLVLSHDGRRYLVHAGLPVEHLKEELQETVIEVGSGLVVSVLLLAGISYFLAGIMLKPIREIEAQVRDISEKHLDSRMPTSGEQDEFNRLARTLNKVFDRLQQAFLEQKRLLADASHELKTPLTTIRLALDDIRSGMIVGCPDPQAKNHERMMEQVLRMERLVKGLLDLSALEIEATAVREEMDLAPVLLSLAEDYVFLGDMRGIGIRTELPERLALRGDAEKLVRAFSNLMDNALKYNEAGGWVTITGKQTAAGVTVVLANSGPGVPAEDIPHIFDQFYRVEKSRSQRHGGSGLGLAIAKRIVELHGGRVTLASIPGEQTEVTVSLPG